LVGEESGAAVTRKKREGQSNAVGLESDRERRERQQFQS